MKVMAIDLGKAKSVMCLLEQCGKAEFETVATRPQEMHDLIVKHAPTRVVFEIGSQAGWMYDLCVKLGVSVKVAATGSEALRWRNVKRKTDRDDALRLAKMEMAGEIQEVHMPPAAIRDLRVLVEHRHKLVCERTRIKNAIRCVLDREAQPWPVEEKTLGAKAQKALETLAQENSEKLWGQLLEQHLERLKQVRERIKWAEGKLDALTAEIPAVKVLQSIPGVGPRLSEALVAAIDDPKRFESKNQVGAYLGLTPIKYQSGKMDRNGRISKRGPATLRGLLVQAAWAGLRHNPWMKEVFDRVKGGSKSRRKQAVVAVARRLAVVAWAMLRDNKEWDATKCKAKEAREAKPAAENAA